MLALLFCQGSLVARAHVDSLINIPVPGVEVEVWWNSLLQAVSA